MANDVTIVVEASLGDTLLKLDMAKHAVNDLGDEGEKTAAKLDASTASTGFFETAVGGLNGVLGQSVPLLGGFSVPVAALPALLFAAMIAAVALADAIGTLVAIVADFIAPAGLVVGLLGGLAAAFVVGAAKAAGGKGPFKEFGDTLSHLGDMFQHTATILGERFLPYLNQLAGGAKEVLKYVDKLAHMSLKDAFQSLSTTGVQMLNNFVNKVSAVIAKPIRLAFKIAFGTGKGGNEFSSVVSDWWKRLSDFFFGYTAYHPIVIGGRSFKMKKEHVDGVFQPLIDWFNRHDFTEQGQKIGHQLMDGFIGGDAPHRMGQFLVASLIDAFKTVFWGWVHQINRFIEWTTEANPRIIKPFADAWNKIKRTALDAWNAIKRAAVNALGEIRDAFNSPTHAARTLWGILKDIGKFFARSFVLAITWPVRAAQAFWGILKKVAGFFERVFNFTVNWPSPPGWLSTVLGLGGGGAPPNAGGGKFHGYTPPTSTSSVLSSVAGAGGDGGGGVHFHFHGPTHFSDAASRRREAAAMGQDIARAWRQKAGG